MVLTSEKKQFNCFLLLRYFVILFLHVLIFNLHCQLVLSISVNMLHKDKSQCKILIVPEEGWFGQPKYSTPS